MSRACGSGESRDECKPVYMIIMYQEPDTRIRASCFMWLAVQARQVSAMCILNSVGSRGKRRGSTEPSPAVRKVYLVIY